MKAEGMLVIVNVLPRANGAKIQEPSSSIDCATALIIAGMDYEAELRGQLRSEVQLRNEAKRRHHPIGEVYAPAERKLV